MRASSLPSGKACILPGQEQETRIVTEHDMRLMFQRVNTKKTAGPDGITGCVLKACANQLSPVFTEILKLLLFRCIISRCFKKSITEIQAQLAE